MTRILPTLPTVPTLSIAFMAITAVVSILLPIALIIIVKKKAGGKLKNVFIGAATFVLFALILESLVLKLVLNAAGIDTSAGREAALKEHLAFLAIVGGLAAGLFEEVGRYLAMRFVMKKPLLKENSLMYGLGHGGIEAILSCGVTYVSNVVISLLINSGDAERLFKNVPTSMIDQSMETIEPLWSSSSVTFLLPGLERISAIMIHICLSYIVYRAVKDSNIKLLIAAIFIHAAIDGVLVVVAQFVPQIATELILLAVVLVLAFFTLKAYKSEQSLVEEPSEPSPRGEGVSEADG